MNPGRQVDGAFASAPNGAAAAYKPDDDLDAMLKADESDKGMAGHTKGFGDYGQTKEGDSGVYYDGVDEGWQRRALHRLSGRQRKALLQAQRQVLYKGRKRRGVDARRSERLVADGA